MRFRAKVVLYPKDTEKWKQFTTERNRNKPQPQLFCIPKILKNESNSQHSDFLPKISKRCFVSQRYWKMKAIHNYERMDFTKYCVVLYPKDTEKWKQFTTKESRSIIWQKLFCIPKILKNESNSQPAPVLGVLSKSCFVSQRYWKMKAIHNNPEEMLQFQEVVLYPKDTEKWKQFTTVM